MKTLVMAMLGLLMLSDTVQSQAEHGADLEAYLEEIRASGISEMGRSHIRSVASVCVGSSILEYRLDEVSGRYWPSYMSATCPSPNADTPEIDQWKKLRLSDAEMLVDKLKPFADADDSGFVTTKEATDFRWLVEFGYLVAQVIRDEGPSIDFIVRASGKDLEDAMGRIEAYKGLAQRITEAGVTHLPDVTVADAGSPFE